MIVVWSAIVSSFGVTVPGSAARPATLKATATPPLPPPIVPTAGVTLSSERIKYE